MRYKMLLWIALGSLFGCDSLANPDVKPFSVVRKTLYVGPEQVDCVGVGPQKCLLVREKTTEEWTYFYDTILGFHFQPGYRYTLDVKRETLRYLPEDASPYVWTLRKVTRKEPFQ
ncbi:MAG TPA: DUF4377 domain-containing protein [Rhodothermales bacterium]|nr:DUF4377 domain-containing protein [Rhodothermales bacterium]HRR10336.1 DUF4377 domain-containing protein [Rhodothermales bacterium]